MSVDLSTATQRRAKQEDDFQDMFQDEDTGIDVLEFKTVLSETLDYLKPWVEEARKDFEFYALKQWPDEDVERMKKIRRAALVFDRTRPIIDAVTGSEVTNRYEAKFKAREVELDQPDNIFSEEVSDLYEYTRDNCNARHHDSAAFKDCVTVGVGCTETVMDYVRNPDGEILVKHVPILEVGWDGASVEPNLADARWILRDKWVDYDELIQLFGREEIDEVIASAGTTSMGGGHKGIIGRLMSKVVEDQRAGYSQKGVRYYDPRTKRLRLWEWQYRKRFYGTRVFYPDIAKLVQTPEMLQLFMQSRMNPQSPSFEPPVDDVIIPNNRAAEAISDIAEEVSAFNAEVLIPAGVEGLPMPEYIEDFPEERYYRCYVAGEKKLKEQRILVGNFTYQFMTCFEDWSEPEFRRFFGVMRPMRDPQQYANKFLSQAIHMWAANPKGALLAEKSFFEDREKAASEWAEATGFITVRDGALQSAKPRFMHLTQSVSMRGIETLLAHAIGSVSSSVGVSEQYFVGGAQDLKRTAGSAVEHVAQQSLITLSNPFDSLKLYRERHARLWLGYVREFMDEKTIMRILGMESQIAQSIKDPEFVFMYDILVEDAPDSKSKQEEVFRMMLESNFLPQLLQMGVPPPPSIAKYFPLPGDIRSDFEMAFKQAYDLHNLMAESQKLNAQMQIIQAQMMMQAAQQDPALAMQMMAANMQPQQPPGGGGEAQGGAGQPPNQQE